MKGIVALARKHRIPLSTLQDRLKQGQSVEEATRKRETHPRHLALLNGETKYESTPCEHCGCTVKYRSSANCINTRWHEK